MEQRFTIIEPGVKIFSVSSRFYENAFVRNKHSLPIVRTLSLLLNDSYPLNYLNYLNPLNPLNPLNT